MWSVYVGTIRANIIYDDIKCIDVIYKLIYNILVYDKSYF